MNQVKNLFSTMVAALLGIVALVTGICTLTGHNVVIGVMALAMAWVLAKTD
jgi:hypothetical protein